jgi:hypothetical protein
MAKPGSAGGGELTIESSINSICDLLKPSFLYSMLLEKVD